MPSAEGAFRELPAPAVFRRAAFSDRFMISPHCNQPDE
jgi:hypothetical protein